MSKWRNKGLWLSIAALIPLVLKGFNVDILPSNYNEIVNALLSTLVLAGVISNPSSGTGYSDTIVETTEGK